MDASGKALYRWRKEEEKDRRSERQEVIPKADYLATASESALSCIMGVVLPR